jgi:lipoprotein-anchoring transpeptidase ErfK/SrfK
MRHLSRILVSYLLAAFLCALALTTSASAAIVVDINRAAQRMAVTVDGAPRYNWRVSTARRGYITPHSIFFYGGFAIHGSYEISHLGRPASHGCVRLDPGNAAILFGLVQREGMAATTIVIH